MSTSRYVLKDESIRWPENLDFQHVSCMIIRAASVDCHGCTKFLSQLLKKKVHPITGRSRGPLRNEEEQTAAPEAVDQAGDDLPTEDSQESGEPPTNDDGIEPMAAMLLIRFW